MLARRQSSAAHHSLRRLWAKGSASPQLFASAARPASTLAVGSPADVPESVPATKLVKFEGNLLLMGLGSIGAGTLPLLLKHIDMRPDQVTVLTGEDCADAAAAAEKRYPGVKTKIGELTSSNYVEMLDGLGVTADGDMVVNLTVDVGSVGMMEWCAAKGINYVDTVVEPWKGYYVDPDLTPSQRSNYALRETALELKEKLGPNSATAVITHGANPGMVSHFVKQALQNISADRTGEAATPANQEGWAELAQSLGVKAVHIAERDTQVQATPKEVGQFVNTWSIDGFISEGCQPAELGWGTHEKELPPLGARHEHGCGAAIYIERPGASTRVRTWTPMEGHFHGWLITHNEAISLADYFTIGTGDNPTYRPTVHYAYHPCDDAVLSVHELAGKNWVEQERKKLIVDEIISGVDELGVLIMGTKPDSGEHFCYWYGSQLEIEQSRKLIESNSATSLQVTAAAMAATVWCMRNPREGIKEPEQIPHDEILGIMQPYIAPVIGEYTDWTPLHQRETLFKEDIDKEDPWQFKNVIVGALP